MFGLLPSSVRNDLNKSDRTTQDAVGVCVAEGGARPYIRKQASKRECEILIYSVAEGTESGLYLTMLVVGNVQAKGRTL
jgi:hypothetical protein